MLDIKIEFKCNCGNIINCYRTDTKIVETQCLKCLTSHKFIINHKYKQKKELLK